MRIKKTSATTPTTAQVVNTYSESQAETYSADYINNLNTYSTTEKRIGTWIDNKPIYRKVISVASSNFNSSANTFNINHNISNIEQITNYNCMVYRGYFRKMPMIYYSTPTSYSGSLVIDATKMTFELGNGVRDDNFKVANSIYVTIEYTKTTDTVS